MILSNYIRICDAIVCLMKPLVEVVIHDIEKNSIAYVNGGLSGRKIGDASFIAHNELDNLDNITYPKMNFDGKRVKSISVALEERWLLCINCDISIFSKMQTLGNVLLNNRIDQPPSSLFANDWQEKLHTTIHTYLENNNLRFDHLNQMNKKLLTKHLFELGAFNEKNAADYVAKILNIGRATIFKYLKEWRNK